MGVPFEPVGHQPAADQRVVAAAAGDAEHLAFVEMALAVAREHLRSETVTLADLEIQQPMLFNESMR
jgi:hypothetical protein